MELQIALPGQESSETSASSSETEESKGEDAEDVSLEASQALLSLFIKPA